MDLGMKQRKFPHALTISVGIILVVALAVWEQGGANRPYLVGVDSAGRGYRDDVAQLIDAHYGSNPAVKQAAEEAARLYQRSLALDLNTLGSTESYIREEAQEGACGVDEVGDANFKTLHQALDDVYARTFNTPARIARREAFIHKAPSALSIDLPPPGACTPTGAAAGRRSIEAKTATLEGDRR